MWYNPDLFFLKLFKKMKKYAQDRALVIPKAPPFPKHHDQPDKHGYKPGLTWQLTRMCSHERNRLSRDCRSLQITRPHLCLPHFLHRLWEKEKLKFSSLIIFHTSPLSWGKLNFPWMPFFWYPKNLSEPCSLLYFLWTLCIFFQTFYAQTKNIIRCFFVSHSDHQGTYSLLLVSGYQEA